MRIHSSARRHRVSVDDMLHAMRCPLWLWPPNDGVSIRIGPGRDGQLLEFGVILDEEGEELLIHAMPARLKFLP